MGLLNALSNAVSGLNINQRQLDVLSQNISNVNTTNYSTEVVNQAASFLAGQGTGVSLQSITRAVDDYLTAAVQSQTSDSSSASTVQSYYSQIENLLGAPGTANSLDQNINAFFSAMQNLANAPTASSETSAVNSAVTLASQVAGLAGALQSLRAQADAQVNDGLSSVNADLQALYKTNTALERAAATKQSIAGLLDQRDAALTDIAQYMDISPTYSSDGEVTISTGNGLSLLTQASVSSLSYVPASSAQTFINNGSLSPILVTTYDASGNTIGKPVTLATGGTSSTVTTSLTSGKLAALLSVRDSIIPNILSQVDGLAANLRDSVNAITNAGTSYPPPNSYTGDRLVVASSVSQYSGSVEIALLDSSGNPVPSPYTGETNGLQPLTLNLATLQGSGGTGVLSAGDIVKAINQYYGSPQNKVQLGNLNNVQLGVLSNTIPDSGNTLSVDFNLNNLSGTSAPFLVSGLTLLDNTGTPVSGSTVTSTQPTITPLSYQASATNTVTVSASGVNTLNAGDQIYLNAASAPTVGGQTLTSGYYTVKSVSGNSFDITLPGVTTSATVVSAGASDTALPAITSVASGASVSTGANGTFSITGLNTSVPYYIVQANVATVDASGTLINSTVSYRVPNNVLNSRNNTIGATSATGGATLIQPTTIQPLVTAALVDANGNPLPTTNGSYGNQQGYLQITANNSSYTIAINQLDSSQLGLPEKTPPIAGTNQGFSQYFGLNSLFNSNNLTATGDTIAGSAINLSVESRLINNPGLISTGTLSPGTQPTSANSPPNFTSILAPGDNSISQRLASLATATQSFGTLGGMPSTVTTLSQYAGQIIAKTSSDSTVATNSAGDSQTLLAGFTSRAQAVSGVNLDQELANTVIYQNAYTASTRVITVVSSMFQELLGIIQ